MAIKYQLDDRDFRKIAQLVRDKTGIVVDERKRAFVQSRLGRRLRVLGLDDFTAYCQVLDDPQAGEAEQAMLANAVTTNFTSFFREPYHFDYLATAVLPAILAGARERNHRLRIWSAGCSTGEEPYSLAMVLCEHRQKFRDWDCRILATDLDTNVLAHAGAGIYDAERTPSIPSDLQRHYVTSADDGQIAIRDLPRSLVTFKQLNLLGDWPMKGPFDVIFCRNVTIYFDKPTQRTLLDRFARILRPDGWLFVGHSESLLNLTDRFHLVGRTVYRRIR
ncbi:CheR family methyltransferase [Rhodopila globiformis]|uniref:Chemotaxis protein methyltransferase n=1 Tax=Rhodopila globiformis TaxID=1071 RepID=A0A2S6MV57_RHOGL|nr:protein-glutamate O-methyltransferase CheR [Rhodopila globiformis]PPQ26228.1 chemotaxis protein CheR [Rhodopila globiformis]